MLLEDLSHLLSLACSQSLAMIITISTNNAHASSHTESVASLLSTSSTPHDRYLVACMRPYHACCIELYSADFAADVVPYV